MKIIAAIRHARFTRTTALIKLLMLLIVCALLVSQVFAESLFRANATMQADTPAYTPHSLFTQPNPKHVGDIVTITINETASLTTDSELKITRNQNIQENGTTLFNSMTRFLLDKIPFLPTQRLQTALEAPSFNGLDNSNNFGSKAESSRDTKLTDTITCQVMQVLPNGFLIVQGHKTVDINRDRQDMVVSGIINPYYLNRQNQIDSNKVANFQLVQGGRGAVSRQQSDGIANKVYQFFN
ncbi:MAG: flagellar basal body L-ring protein FlgH [Candidatus Melainabacteria bacterium]